VIIWPKGAGVAVDGVSVTAMSLANKFALHSSKVTLRRTIKPGEQVDGHGWYLVST
jgi:hypothetical protein